MSSDLLNVSAVEFRRLGQCFIDWAHTCPYSRSVMNDWATAVVGEADREQTCASSTIAGAQSTKSPGTQVTEFIFG